MVYPILRPPIQSNLNVNPDRRAKLSIPTEKFTFAFTEPSKLSTDQLAVWETLMKLDGKTSRISDFIESVKTQLSEFAKNMASKKKLDSYSVTMLGLDRGPSRSSQDYASIIFGAPSAVFASKKILDFHMNDYRQSIEAKDQARKAKLKKESDSSTGF